MCSSTTSHKFSKRLDNKNNCYTELKIETLLNKTSELNGELQRKQPKRFSLPCGGKTKESQIRKETKKII